MILRHDTHRTQRTTAPGVDSSKWTLRLPTCLRRFVDAILAETVPQHGQSQVSAHSWNLYTRVLQEAVNLISTIQRMCLGSSPPGRRFEVYASTIAWSTSKSRVVNRNNGPVLPRIIPFRTRQSVQTHTERPLLEGFANSIQIWTLLKQLRIDQPSAKSATGLHPRLL